MSLKAICPMCETICNVPGNFSIARSRPGYADRIYWYHKRADGSWCLSNGAKVIRKDWMRAKR